jgi:branched-subunit amino acid transport protein AzlD
MTTTYAVAALFVSGAVTLLIRAFPFLLFGRNKELSPHISYLGNILPFAAMGILIIYCLKNVSWLHFPSGIPEILAIIVVVLLHLWKRNNLISIGVGTAFYMLLIQQIF